MIFYKYPEIIFFLTFYVIFNVNMKILLIDINPNNFHRTQDQILENLQEAFKKHQENLNNLSTKK